MYTKRYVEPAFLDSLHRLDPLLEPRWHSVRQRWEIWRGGKYIMAVQTTDGEYAPLDNRVIQRLFVIDTYKYRNQFDYIRNLNLQDQHLLKMKQREQDEFVRSCHRDMKPFLIGRKSVTARVKEDVTPSNEPVANQAGTNSAA